MSMWSLCEGDRMKHIVHFSGGKDSTAMLLMMLEKGMQIDDIIFCDTGMEFPEMYTHIAKVEQYIGRPITKIKADKSFEYYMFEHTKTKSKKKNKGYGWCRNWVRWCTRLLKKEPTRKYLKEKYKDEPLVQYLGIAYDEPKRHARIMDNEVHPLFDWEITESEALQYCYARGFDWGGLYEQFSRVSCWCCPLQGLREVRSLRKYHPTLFSRLREMDKRVDYKFRPDYSVEDLEIRFQLEEEFEAQGKPTGRHREFQQELKRRLGRSKETDDA